MAQYIEMVEEYRKKSDEFKYSLNALRDVMRHSMGYRTTKMKNNWPLNGLELGNRIIRQQIEEYTQLLQKINDVVEDENLYEDVMDEHLIVKGEIERLQRRMAEHATQLGRNGEFEFINLDFLEDPSNGDFDWRTEETIEFLMMNEFNIERRRLRRVKEGNDFEKADFETGFMPDNLAGIVLEFKSIKEILKERKRILMNLHSIDDNNFTEASEKLISEAVSSLNDIFRIVVKVNQLYRRAKRTGNNNQVYISTRIKKIIDRCTKQAPFSTQTLRRFNVSFSQNNGFLVNH